MRLPTVLLIGAALLPSAPGGASADARTDVHLFRYAGIRPQTAAAFDEFQAALREQLLTLGQSLSTASPDAIHLRLERIVAGGAPGAELADPITLIPSFDAERRWWRDKGALALLTGRLSRIQDDGLAILSRVFWGDLGDSAAEMSISIELPLDGEYYDDSKDSHAAAILFAFANHLPPDCAREPERFAILSAAQQLALAVANSDPGLGGALLQRVSESLRDLEQSPCDAS